MLKKFSVENFKNFRDKITIDFSDSKKYSFNEELVKDGIISKSIIYGKNATGKTNLGLALFDIKLVLHDSNRVLLPLESYEDFMNAYSLKNEVTFSYEFIFGSKIIQYNYQKRTIDELVYEELIVDNELLIKYNFTTSGFVNNISEAQSLNFEFQSKNMSIVKYVANNSNLPIDHPIRQLMKFVSRMLWFNSFQDNALFGYRNGAITLSNYVYKENRLEDLENFLNSCDLDIKLGFIESDNKKMLALKFNDKYINLFRNASSGTRDLVWFYFWIQWVKDSTLLFVDQFDAYYHYETSLRIVEMIKGLTTTQVVMTTHNTYLLNNDVLRPDCYFILSNSMIKNLPQLTPKAIGQTQNLEKMYRNGEFD